MNNTESQLASFENLEFNQHPCFAEGLYGHEDDDTYEVAMWFDGRDTMLPLSLYDDVLAGQSPSDITRLMHQAHLNDFAWVTLLHSLRDAHRKEMELDN